MKYIGGQCNRRTPAEFHAHAGRWLAFHAVTAHLLVDDQDDGGRPRPSWCSPRQLRGSPSPAAGCELHNRTVPGFAIQMAKNPFVISVAKQETRMQSHRHMTRSLATYKLCRLPFSVSFCHLECRLMS